MKTLNMPAGAHGTWKLLAEMHRPSDATAAIQELVAQGLGLHDIADRLGVGIAAVEQVLIQRGGLK